MSFDSRRPIRILYVHNGSDLYGPSRSLLRLVTRLDRRRFDPHVLLPSDGPLAVALAAEGVPVTVMSSLSVMTRPVMRWWRLVRFLLRLPFSVLAVVWAIRRLRIDLVHTNVAPLVSVAAATRIARVRHVWHLREFFHEFGPLWKVYRRYMLACADKILCVSTPVAAQFPAGTGKVEVLHNGLPLEEFEPVPINRVNRFRAQHGLEDWRLVGVVGRIKAHRKGQDVFADAVAELKRRCVTSQVKFVIIGSPFPGNEEHLTRLRQQIGDLGLEDDVVLTGDVEDVKAAIASLEVLVLPSAAPEPFGGVVLEAMALGVPVVATRVGGTIEQIDDGRTGILVEPGNALKLADAIERLVIDEVFRRSAGMACRRRVEERFAFTGMIARLEGIYREVVTA